MPRILGVDIPNDKRTVISLQYIYGIGPYLAGVLCERTGIDPDKRARDLTEDDLAKLAVAPGQRIHGGRPAPPPGAAEHRPAARHRLLSRSAAPQGAAGPRPADPDQRADPQGPPQDGRRQEGRQGTAVTRSLSCGLHRAVSRARTAGPCRRDRVVVGGSARLDDRPRQADADSKPVDRAGLAVCSRASPEIAAIGIIDRSRSDGTVAKAKKRKTRRNVSRAVVHIKATFNNTTVTITDPNGDAFCWASSGTVGFKGSRKSTPFAAQRAAETAAAAATKYGVKEVEVKVKGPGSGRESAITAIQARACRSRPSRMSRRCLTTAAALPRSAGSEAATSRRGLGSSRVRRTNGIDSSPRGAVDKGIIEDDRGEWAIARCPRR